MPRWSTRPTKKDLFSPECVRGDKRWRGSVQKSPDGIVSFYLRYESGPRPQTVSFKLMLIDILHEGRCKGGEGPA